MINIEEQFYSLFDVYAKDFSQAKINTIISVNNYSKCYKLMYGIPVGINAKKILELGIGSEAVSTYIFLEACKITGGYLISIDTNNAFGYEKYPAYDRNKWTVICGDSATVEINDIFDIIMIDTSHEREQTMKELNKYVPMLKKGGYLYMHDTNEKGVLLPLMIYIIDNPNTLEFFYMEDNLPQMTIFRKI